jgi:hypothetical protein
MDKPQTARASNSQLTGESYIVAGTSSHTIASGAVHMMAMQRKLERRKQILAILRSYVLASEPTLAKIAQEIIDTE